MKHYNFQENSREKDNFDSSRRKMLRQAGLLCLALCGTGIIDKLNAANGIFAEPLAELQNHPQHGGRGQRGQRVPRKAKYISENCKVTKQLELIKASKGKKVEVEGCTLCVEACPVKALTAQEVPDGQGLKKPVLEVDKCVGCARCLRVCPEDPKAWEMIIQQTAAQKQE